MLKKKHVFLAIVITIFFLIIAFLTTFRLAIYSFIVCYIGVIIAKSRNKKLKVPVTDFFVLTFFVSILFAFVYSYSPRLQYYEFVMLHSRWEISKISKIDQIETVPLTINSDFVVGIQTNVDTYFLNSSGDSLINQNFSFYQTNIIDLVTQKSDLNNWLHKDISYYNTTKDLYVFTKPDKKVFKLFSKEKFYSNSHSVTNFAFSIFFFFIFLFCLFNFIFRFKYFFSTLLNQYPIKGYMQSVLILLYITIYSIITYTALN